MRIEEIVIEGFKSYIGRTHISNWDQGFNAITGLNGSGKSNILDAICFVLGITNLNKLRVYSMRELIYKRGQTSVSKASVTITFNNDDKANSPIGFESCDKIIVTRQVFASGKTKCIVNGSTTTLNTVGNLFQSARLNINNPNFLIMQGRITKVLNMKPPEILAMIEEVVGTSMYNEKRNDALKTIAKKEGKIKECDQLLLEVVNPELEKLNTEKRLYKEYQDYEPEVQRLKRIIVADEYTKNQEKFKRLEANVEAMENEVRELEMNEERAKEEISKLKKQNVSKKEMEIIEELEKNIKEYSNEITSNDSKYNTNRESIEYITSQKNELLSDKAEMERNLLQKSEEYERLEGQLKEMKSEYDEKKDQVTKTEELFVNLSCGIIPIIPNGRSCGYWAQLQEARDSEAHALDVITNVEKEKFYLNEDLTKIEPSAIEVKKNYEMAKKVVQDLTTTLSNINWGPSIEEGLMNDKTILENKVEEITEKCKILASNLSYSDSIPNLNRSQIQGRVVELISVQDEKYLDALDICAGRKLYEMVVENEVVAAQIIEGNLQETIKFIPLNKVQTLKLSSEEVESIQNIAPGRINLAKNLIKYDERVESAMVYVFGSTLICEDADAAIKVFDSDIQMRCVTLNGGVYNVYNEVQTVEGGLRPTSSGALKTIQELKENKQQLKNRQQELNNLNATIKKTQKTADEYNKIKRQLDLKANEVASTKLEIIHKAEYIKSRIVECDEIIENHKKQYQTALELCQRIEKDMKEFQNNKEAKLEEIKKTITKGKDELDQNNSLVLNMQQKVHNILLGKKQIESGLIKINNEIEEADNEIKILSQAAESITNERDQLKNSLEQFQGELEKKKEERAKIEEDIKTKTKYESEARLKIIKITHELGKVQKDKTSTRDAIALMEEEYKWILEQKHLFGKPNTTYDFMKQNPDECRGMLQQLEMRRVYLRSNFKPKVMSIIESMEKKKEPIEQKLRKIKEDQKKIKETIDKLDKEREKSLQKTWEQVNTEMLPNSFAKIQPLEGQDMTDGLEVKVRLGGVWKQSLSELSGGQRTLVALSLILAIFKYKPAPIYILDEIDAALDISHTQNIGHLIRTRFKESQFIIVSLKDGMFSNANVIFRTRFRDGTSVVESSQRAGTSNSNRF